MYILNVTVNIEGRIHDRGLQWIKTDFIREMMSSNKFESVLMSRVLIREAAGGKTYSLQFTSKDKETLQAYYREDDTRIFRKFEAFDGKIVFFRTEMQILYQQ